MITKQKGVVDMFGLTFGIAAIAALGVGASSFMEYFHNFKFKNKRKVIRMTTIKVNLYVRKPKQHVKYHFSSFNIDQDHFPMKLDIKEVINLTEKQRKKYKTIAKTFLTTTVGFLSLTSKSMAQVLTTTTSQNTGMFGLPTDFIEPMLMLIKMALGEGFY